LATSVLTRSGISRATGKLIAGVRSLQRVRVERALRRIGRRTRDAADRAMGTLRRDRKTQMAVGVALATVAGLAVRRLTRR
jgi:hypothetical protein